MCLVLVHQIEVRELVVCKAKRVLDPLPVVNH